MSRNIKSNLKNPPGKLLLKTTFKQYSHNRNNYNLSPSHIKNILLDIIKTFNCYYK